MKRIVCVLISCIFTVIFSYSSFAETERDLVSRITDISCSGENHSIYLQYDSAITPFGPVKFEVDGKDVNSGLTISIPASGNETTYTNKGFAVTFKPSDTGKSFTKVATIKGRDVVMNCSYKSKLKFFRSRELVEPETPGKPSDKQSQGSSK